MWLAWLNDEDKFVAPDKCSKCKRRKWHERGKEIVSYETESVSGKDGGSVGKV
jgi:hypothetical protein